MVLPGMVISFIAAAAGAIKYWALAYRLSTVVVILYDCWRSRVRSFSGGVRRIARARRKTSAAGRSSH